MVLIEQIDYFFDKDYKRIQYENVFIDAPYRPFFIIACALFLFLHDLTKF